MGGFRLYTCAIASEPELISAAIAKHAKYVERNGFCENHLYGTVTTQCCSSISRTRTPEKKAAGSFDNRYILNRTGLRSDLMNLFVMLARFQVSGS